MKLNINIIVTLFLIFLFGTPQAGAQKQQDFKNDEIRKRAWVDSVYQSLSIDERIAQLIMVRSFSNQGQHYTDSITRLLQKYNIGGVIFFKGTPSSQAHMTNSFQEAAKTPLLVAMDAEWGPAMRHDGVIAFPRQLALGAIENDTLIYEMGMEIGRQLRQLGVHVNFAPVVDVNNNASNPVINSRSFGENNIRVAGKSLAYMKGMQDQGIISVAKHFPGHGDTDKDSHFTLPIISKPFAEIDSIHLFPFRHLINNGLTGVMSAHLTIPAIDESPKGIMSLSPAAINGLLKRTLGFEGLVFTDGLEMKAIADYVHPDSVEIKALLAGNDILLLPVNTPRAIRNIKNAVEKGIMPASLIEEKCKKVLSYKFKVGLSELSQIDVTNLSSDLNPPSAELLNRKLIEASLTVPINHDALLPLRRPDTLRMASVEIGVTNTTVFNERLNCYALVDGFAIEKNAASTQFTGLQNKLGGYDLVFACIRNTSQNPKEYGINRQTRDFVCSLATQTRVVLVLAGNPYSLSLFEPIDSLAAVLITYHDTDLSVDLAVQALFGAFKVSGKLPVSVSGSHKKGSGFELESLQRLKYTIPEEAGIERGWLLKADSIAQGGITESAYPGCRIMAVLDGKVIYDKCFGYHTYNQKQPVRPDDIYDVASITKILATTASVMKLYESDLLDIDHRVSKYLPELQKANKSKIVIRDLMAHQAGLPAWIPFYQKLLIDGSLDTTVFSKKKHGDYQIEVAGNLYMNKNHLQKMFDSIASTPLIKHHKYLYSDLGFFWLKEIVETLAGTSLEAYAQENFYKPLGMRSTAFNPTRNFSLSRIVPTEDDTEFRKQLVHGYVHDPGAAMQGGVGGHAGLFSTANDIAIMMQMLMNHGYYGGIQYFEPKFLSEFTRTQFPLNNNRRGLGFDKPQLKKEKDGPTSLSVSKASFGHSGFTGVYAWADPEHRLVYIFLSNRVHPSATNNKINRLNIRTSIHQVFYDAIQLGKVARGE